MHNTLILGVAIAFLVGGIGGYLLKGATMSGGQYRGGYEQKEKMPGGEAQRMGMADHSSHGMGGHGMHTDMMVESEREFIEHMIPHHQEAVDTAKEVLARGATTPEIKTLVEGIVAAQEKEIADMKMWYEAWYGTPYVDTGTYTPMMRELENLSGADIDKAFLEDMVHHHMGAIMMARSVAPHIEHEEIRTLADAIITSQSAEITQMRTLRAGLE